MRHWASGPCRWPEKECDWSSTPHPLQASLSLLLMGPKTQIGHLVPNQTSQDAGSQALPPPVSRVACSEHGTLLMVCWHVGHHCRARERSEVLKVSQGGYGAGRAPVSPLPARLRLGHRASGTGVSPAHSPCPLLSVPLGMTALCLMRTTASRKEPARRLLKGPGDPLVAGAGWGEEPEASADRSLLCRLP